MAVTDNQRNKEAEFVQLDHLSRRMGRYNLVVAVAKRSRDIEERVDSVLVPSSGVLVQRAMQDIARGKVKVFQSSDKEPENPREHAHKPELAE
jgi:DNA-directed RNA polymerase subunit K/omega